MRVRRSRATTRTSLTTPGGTITATYDDQDRLTAYDGFDFTYNENGEVETRYDTIALETTVYDYDVMGNLRSVVLPDATLVEYVTDPRGRRVGKRVDGKTVVGWLYGDQLEPVAELDEENAVASRFVYGSSPHTPDYMVKGGTTYRILTDHVGSVRLVVNSTTGVVAQRLEYDEWGNVVTDTSPRFQPFGFAGGLYDPDTELVRFGARDYDPSVGRWLTKDPIRFDGGENLYGYVDGDPVNLVDPTGLAPMDGFPNENGGFGGWGLLRSVFEFLKNYNDMLNANWKHSDKYFHCKANCEAVRNGSSSAAKAMSGLREGIDEYIKGDSPEACDADREANQTGRNLGSGSCADVCDKYRPNGLPDKY